MRCAASHGAASPRHVRCTSDGEQIRVCQPHVVLDAEAERQAWTEGLGMEDTDIWLLYAIDSPCHILLHPDSEDTADTTARLPVGQRRQHGDRIYLESEYHGTTKPDPTRPRHVNQADF